MITNPKPFFLCILNTNSILQLRYKFYRHTNRQSFRREDQQLLSKRFYSWYLLSFRPISSTVGRCNGLRNVLPTIKQNMTKRFSNTTFVLKRNTSKTFDHIQPVLPSGLYRDDTDDSTNNSSSHEIISVSNDLVDIAQQNAETVWKRQYSYRASSSNTQMSNFFERYESTTLGDHELPLDDDEIDNNNNDNNDGWSENDQYDARDDNPSPLKHTLMYEGKETYFQLDYRNHATIINQPMQNLLCKIETTLYNAHKEPYGKFRGCGTVKENIKCMKDGVKFRLGRNKSYEKDGCVVPIRYKKLNVTGYIQLKRAIIRLLKDRHTIYGSGNTNTITELKWKKIGQSFFGPDSDICINYRDAELILCDLWFRGHSDKFNHLQKWHYRLLRKKQYQLLNPPDPNEPIKPKIKKEKRYIPRQPSKNRFIWSEKRVAALERQLELEKGIW